MEWPLARERRSGHWRLKGGMVIGWGNIECPLEGERWNGHWKKKGGMFI